MPVLAVQIFSRAVLQVWQKVAGCRRCQQHHPLERYLCSWVGVEELDQAIFKTIRKVEIIRIKLCVQLCHHLGWVSCFTSRQQLEVCLCGPLHALRHLWILQHGKCALEANIMRVLSSASNVSTTPFNLIANLKQSLCEQGAAFHPC